MKQTRRLISLLVALTPAFLEAQTAPQWSVGTTPVTIIGNSSGDPQQELLQVGGARRLTDGRVVLVNGKPTELRIYDARGKFLSSIGRKGGGPGEFGRRIGIMAVVGDTILVFDQDNDRWSRFLTSGKLVGEGRGLPAGAPAQVTLYRRTFVRDLPVTLNRCAVQLLDVLPPAPPPSLREAIPDGAGRFWLRTDNSSRWSIYSSAGRLLAMAQLPPGLDLYHVADGYLVGRRMDSDDVEQVVVLRVAMPVATRPACIGLPGALPAADGPRVAELKAVLRNAMTAAEVAYADVGRYVSTTDSLRMEFPSDLRFRILRSSTRGWAAVVFDTRSTLSCMFGIGDAVPLGWPEGMLRCGA